MGRCDRAAATARVTTAVGSWLWGRGARIMAVEVGLTKLGARLCNPWRGRWRVDMAAIVDARHTHVVEVKGTRADLVREDLTAGKWVLGYEHLMPWLAVDADIDSHLYGHLDRRWGIVVVDGVKTRVIRRPHDVVDGLRDLNVEAMARALTAQGLPTMMTRNNAIRSWRLMDTGFDRPWRNWCHETDEEEHW